MYLRIRFIPKLAAFCSGGFIIALALGAFFLTSQNHMADKFVKIYGQALANQAAKQAVDATFNQDLVRLQVILQAVTENPHTKVATIHDVENNLLVQAGNSRLRAPQDSVYSSPIVLHDSVAGYVSLAIDENSWSTGSLLICLTVLTALLFSLTLWSLYHSGAIELNKDKPHRKDDAVAPRNEETPQVEPKNTVPKASASMDPTADRVYAVIHIKNLHVLQQQLNGQHFRDLMARLESVIADVMALYGGRRFCLTENYYQLEFDVQHDKGEALFNAACSAHLILELTGIINKIPLDLSAMVSGNRDNIVPKKLSFAGIIMETTAGNEPLIVRRIEFMELGTEDGRRVVSGFRQPFQTLLENQRKQLCQIL